MSTQHTGNSSSWRASLTREDALAGDVFHYGNCWRVTGPRGGVRSKTVLCRRSGQNKTWKTRPDDFRVPLRFGFYEHGEIVPANLAEFHRPEDCPLLDGNDHSTEETHVARVQPVTTGFGPDLYRVICTCGFKTEATFARSSAILSMVAHEAQARGCPIIEAQE